MKLSIVLILFSVLFSVQVIGQTNSYFPYGTYVYKKFDLFPQCGVKDFGFNTVIANSDSSISKPYMEQFEKSIAFNAVLPSDYIHNYSLGYYKIWQAEDTVKSLKAGIRHNIGEEADIDGHGCWIVPIGQTNSDTFQCGPNSSHENQYRLAPVTAGWKLKYFVNFKMKLLGTNIPPNTPVCQINVRYKYSKTINQVEIPYTLDIDTCIVYSDSLSTSQFKDYQISYQFTPSVKSNIFPSTDAPLHETDGAEDTKPGQGIEYIITWLGNVRFAIDYIEVYDERMMAIIKMIQLHLENG